VEGCPGQAEADELTLIHAVDMADAPTRARALPLGGRPGKRRAMPSKNKNLDPNLHAWVAARQRHGLSHAHVQMARELGMNPAKLGALDNHRQEPWKAPLPEFIEELYEKRFGKTRPDIVMTIEERARAVAAKSADRKAAKDARRARRSEASATAAGAEGASRSGGGGHGAVRSGGDPAGA
jgi:hypothetical protein